MEVKLCMRRGVPNLKCTPWGAKNDTIFFKHDVVSNAYFHVHRFFCVYFQTCLCSTPLNNVKVETDEIYFIVSF